MAKRPDSPPVPTGGRPAGRTYEVPEVHRDALSSNFDAIEQATHQYRVELTKFLETGNKSAAVRARKHLSDLISLAQMGRNGIQSAREELVITSEAA